MRDSVQYTSVTLRNTRSSRVLGRWEPPKRRWHITRRVLLLGSGAVVAYLGLWGALAWINRITPEQIAEGREIFSHAWAANDDLAAEGDGLGPVFNAKSCAECHHQGGAGGGGAREFNVHGFAVVPAGDRTKLLTGVVHTNAILPTQTESAANLRLMFPIIRPPARGEPPCQYQPPDFDPLILSEVNTPPLFGLGLIDELSDWSIRSAAMSRSLENVSHELNFNTKTIPAGRVRVLSDGRVGKFGWKGQFATLEDFVAAACAVELGLTNPRAAQHIPKRHVPDENARLDLNKQQFRSLVSYVKQLPRPETIAPSNRTGQIATGLAVFDQIGCAACHTPDFGDLKEVYCDFCLYSLDETLGASYGSDPSVPLPPGEPAADEWKTPPLWGVADSAPYMHDGSAPTLQTAIRAHGGSARGVRERYEQLPERDQLALLAFLGSLHVPADPEAR